MCRLARGAAICATLALAACGSDSSPAPAPTPAPPTDPWSAVDQAAATAYASSSGVSGMTLAIFNRNDQKVFEKTYGTFSSTQRVPVASASKIVAGTVLFRLIGQGLLALDSTTAQVLGWDGARGAITLRHLLSFTSGLTPNAACINNPFITLATCVEQIRDDPNALVATPGTRYDYGSTHLHVAARMAEVVTAKSWNTIFTEQLGAPLGLAADTTFYTLAEQQTGTTNPRVAGGLSTTLDQYARILAISFHRGTYQGFTYAPATLFDAQAVEPYPGVTIGNSPFASIGLPYRYGLAAWLECNTPATGCSTISSPGAFGWTPWVDRANGYYAILGMYKGGLADNGVVDFSVNLAQQLKPLIVQALNP
jgi:CubicO group peptidase (beta-lactamase class C family)